MELSEAELVEIGKSLFVSSILASITPDRLENIIRWCEINNRKYTDQDFPPSQISLIKNPQTSEKTKPWKKFVWRRATDFLTEGPIKVFLGGITPDDIRQGALGDVYFLCALTMLAEKPSRIEQLFITKESNQYGAYAVELCVHGEKQVVVIDDYFPCTGATGGPCFSKSNGSELWVMVLEKAWAKIYGSYERIERGSSNGALRDLTCAPTVTCRFEEGTWEKILEGIQEDFIICASAGSNKSSQQILEGIGLIGSLSYAVIAAQEVSTSQGPVRLVKLRNPWTNAEWQGDWSDQSDKWTPALKKALNFTEEADGTFWMSFEDFKDYFSTVTICRINDSYSYHYFKAKHHKDSHVVVRVSVSRAGFAYISADQREKCCYPKMQAYDYSHCRMILARETEDGLVYVDGKQGTERNLWMSHNFEVGDYQVYLEFNWCSNVKNFVVSTYGEITAEFASNGEVPNFIKEVYATRAITSGVDVVINNNPGLVKYHEILPEGFGYFYLTNPTESKLIEKCYFKTFKNLKILPPYEGAKYEASINPGTSEIVIIKTVPGQKPAISFTSTVTADASANPFADRAKREGIAENRLHPETNKDIGVTVYTLKTNEGMHIYYENNSKNVSFEEEIEFTLRNASVVGITGNRISLKLVPGQKHYIEVKSTGKSWSAQRNCSFTIS